MATVRYIVRDPAEARDFYVSALGFDVVEEWGEAFVIVGRGDLKLWLAGPKTSAAKPMPDGAAPVSGGWNRIVIEVPDIEATVAALKAAGATLRNEITKGPGGAQVLVEDPSGNPVEIFEARKD